MRVTVVGMLIGNAIMISALLIQNHLHLFKLDAASYYIDFVPVELNWTAFLMLNAGVLVIVYLTLIFPSRIISKISPSETMRSE